MFKSEVAMIIFITEFARNSNKVMKLKSPFYIWRRIFYQLHRKNNTKMKDQSDIITNYYKRQRAGCKQ